MDSAAFIKSALTGFSVFGDALSLNQGSIAAVLSGQFDHELKCALHLRSSPKNPTSETELEHPEILAALERLKDVLREPIRRAFELEAERQKADAESARLARFRAANQPHQKGTVSEIAALLGISKAEVRRKKTDGTLDALLDQANKGA